MKCLHLIQCITCLYIIFLLTFSSCQNSNQKVNQSTLDNHPSQTRCYSGSIAGLQEFIEVRWQGDSIFIRGHRIIESKMRTKQLTGKGIFSNNTADVYVEFRDSKKPEQSNHAFEKWSFKDYSLHKSVTFNETSTSLDLYAIQCASNAISDSLLFESFGGFYEGYAVVSKNGYYGLVDSTFQLTIPLIYKDLEIVNEQSIVFYDPQSGQRGILGVNGDTIIPAQYDDIHCFNNGLAACMRDGKWGFINRSGTFIIPPIYTEVNLFRPEPSRHPFNEGLANVKQADGKWIYIDGAGNQVSSNRYFFAKSYNNGQAEVYFNDAWRFIDKKGNCLKNCE